jgi:hypothetical protein
MPILNLPAQDSFEEESPREQIRTETHFQGTYTLVTLRIKLKNNSIIELGDVFTQMEIFEDVFKYSIEGRIRIKDFVGGQEKFMITGGEELSMVIMKPNGMNEILISRSDLIVTKLSEISFTQGNFREYDLYFTTKSTINSMKKKLFKGFGRDRSLESVVKKLFGEMDKDKSHLSIYGANIKLDFPFVSNGMRPLEAINFLAKRACINKDFFLFFERFAYNPAEKITHYFIGFNELKRFWERNQSIPKIIYEPNVDKIGYIHELENEELLHTYFLRVEPNFDHMTNIKSGIYNSRIRTLDLISRNYNDTKINYIEENNLIINDVYNNKIINSKNIFVDFDETTIERLIVKPTNDSISNKAEWIKNDTLGSLINTGIRLTVQISGSSNKIGIGSLVELSVPSDVSKTLNLENPVPHEDQIYSGKYMVTAVKYEFTQKSFNKTLELSRGSFKFNIDNLINKYLVEDTAIL